VDDKAVFLGGFSMGGFGVWRHGLATPDRFAGLVVLSGVPINPVTAGFLEPPPDSAGAGEDEHDPATYLNRAAGLPVFVAHGSADPAVAVGPTRRFVEDLKAAGADVTYREIEGAGHGDYEIWPEVFDWMEKVRRRITGER